MKLAEHVDHIRSLIQKAFDNQFSRLGLGPTKMVDIEKIPQENHTKRKKLDVLISSYTGEFGNYKEAREKALDELTFTLFNRIAAVKVMESLQLFPPIVTKKPEHGDRSFGHKIWLEENPEMLSEELEGLREYFKHEFNGLGETIPLYHKTYPYALLPYVIDLNEIVNAFNAVELDPQVGPEIWQSDDILGWLYESYNNSKKAEHKASKAKTEYDKVSLQSQVYTPRWVVEFLVNNSLGKLYLEMYPNSEIKDRYKIANVPVAATRDQKPLHEVKMIDPASGSGNFLLYGFELFFQLYLDQIENYGADYDEDDIPKLIIENNLHGIDLDDRAIQLAQLGLWIKAKQTRRTINELNFNIVSSDFYLPDFVFVEPIFKAGTTDSKQLSVIEDIWVDLQQAHRFGSLIRIEEKLSLKLHGLVEQSGISLFGDQEIEEYERFKKDFFTNLEAAVNRFASREGSSFLTGKTRDAITFLKLITNKYDVATANPPYTDSSDFGKDLKTFIEANYKRPHKFHTNLYATFIKRCFELTVIEGKVAMVHPPTFMYIKSFEDVRKFILKESHIDLFVEWGYLGMFHPSARVDAAVYILDKRLKSSVSTFIKLNHIYEGKRYDAFLESYQSLIQNRPHSNNYSLPQSKLKIIKSWPFIYWISDKFRDKFGTNPLGEKNKALTGLMTGNNNKNLRFWWEVNQKNLSDYYPKDRKKWVFYQKGGPFEKWYGNNWTVVNYEKDGANLATTDNRDYYFKKGISYSASGSKGASFRFISDKYSFDKGGPCIFSEEENFPTFYLLGFLNSKLSSYIIFCLNPTVNRQVGDLRRLPLSPPSEILKEKVIVSSESCVTIKKKIETYFIYNFEFESSIFTSKSTDLKKDFKNHCDWENYLSTQILINEFVINETIHDIYGLTLEDKAMVSRKEGENVGALPLCKKAKQAYLANEIKEFPLNNIRDCIQTLPEKEFDATEREKIEKEFPQLYQSNNDLEDFCIRHQVNPINVWFWFKESNVTPNQRMNDLAMEFLADLLRDILMEDEDGIIPLVPNAGEKVLLDRVEEKFIEKGFSRAQYSSFDNVLGRDLNEYINHYFFKDLSDHLNLFMYLPKTPFIWHLSSGPEKAFDCYLIIYKWSRDKLLRIRSVYLEHRERSLVNLQSDLAGDDSAKAQNEKEKIYKQLKELESFKTKIDELLQEGYDPILDDGVGKNIAPLQAKGMLPYYVLNAGQLKKYLNADW